VSASSIQLDRKIRYRAEPKTVLAIKHLRDEFHAAMATKMRGRQLSARQQQWFDLGLRYIATEEQEEPSLVVA
jgi:ATP-dependent RNA helicase DHX29